MVIILAKKTNEIYKIENLGYMVYYGTDTTMKF